MEHEPVVDTVAAIVGLLLVAAAAAIGLRRTKLPFTVGLVLVGLVLGVLTEQFTFLAGLGEVTLSPGIILFVFLPTLIFESAFTLDARLLAKNLTPVLALAAPGLLLSTAIVGGMTTLLTPLPLGPALVFGALISATDPVAVVALFKELGAPKRLAILVEGESLFNDATAIVLFRLVVAVVAGGTFGVATIGQGTVEFLVVFLGGLLVGAVIGWLMVRSIALAADEPLVEVALSTVVAYAAFIAAEHYLHVSGVMATVGAGLMVGTVGSTRFSHEVRAYLHQFWEYAAFVANSLIFLLVGMSVRLDALLDHLVPIGWAIVAVFAARLVTVFGLLPLVTRLPNAEPISFGYRTVLWWGGLRGAVALALVLSLPADFPQRDLVMSLAVGVVLFSLLSGGLSMGRVIHAFGLDRPSLVERVARAQAALAGSAEALERLGRLGTAGHFSPQVVGRLEREYREQVERSQRELADLRNACGRQDIRQVLWTQALTVEQTAYRDLFDHGEISEPVLHELELSVELRRDRLTHGGIPETLDGAHPLELRVTDALIGVVERFTPRAGPVQRHRIRALAARYEHDMAALEASRRVADEIEHLGELSGVDPAIVRECRERYRVLETDAMQRLDQVAEHFPAYVRAVQDLTVRRIALDGEHDAVAHLDEAGGMPTSVARAAQGRIRRAQRRLARQEPAGELTPDPADLLARVPFFADLSAEDFGRIVERLVPRTVLAGTDVIRQGERGTSLYLLTRGIVAVLRSRDGGEPRRLARLHAGEFFGETALLTDAPRNATVRAVSDAQLYELRRRDLDRVADVCPAVREALVAAHRTRRSTIDD